MPPRKFRDGAVNVFFATKVMRDEDTRTTSICSRDKKGTGYCYYIADPFSNSQRAEGSGFRQGPVVQAGMKSSGNGISRN